MKIITTPDPRLRQKSHKAHPLSETVRSTVSALRQACVSWEQRHPHELSAAIAAPQLGINQRIILVRDDLEDRANQSFTAFINPEIIKTEGKIVADYEGCLSVPFIYGLVPRPHKAKIKAFLEDGREVRLKAEGYLARTLMHEIDHLNGILFIDHIKDNPDAFFRMTSQGELTPINYLTEIKANPKLFPHG